MNLTTVGVIGCGYWGPNLLRNFIENESANLRWMCDLDEQRLGSMSRRYPSARTTTDCRRLIEDPELDAEQLEFVAGQVLQWGRTSEERVLALS